MSVGSKRKQGSLGSFHRTKVTEAESTFSFRGDLVFHDLLTDPSSPGAQVVGDILCGAYGLLFPHKDPIYDYIKRNIRAIVQLGDPTNLQRISWHAGSSTGNGLFPRADLGKCKDLASEWRSYCDAGDVFCDVPGKSVDVHLGYVREYLDDIVDFIVERVQAAPDNIRKCNVGSNEM
ncbi:MAG: hypothetical protein LQ346_008147 [Caloplaca aetnensis]|nr:MAG: hypothetical protein LQ346_008147 [Caloplaca aetnensis]